MKAKFIGIDGNAGYKTGVTYDLIVREEGNYILITYPRFHYYYSWKAFYDNWMAVRK